MATEKVMIDYDMQNPKKKKSKPKTNVMKKLGSAAGKVIDKLDDKSIKETMLKQAAPMEKLISKPIMERELPSVKLKPGSRPMTVEEGEAFLNGAKAEDIKSGKYKRETPMLAPSLRYATDEEINESSGNKAAKKSAFDKAKNEVDSIFSEMRKSKLESLKKPAKKD
jgi:hypothetical protein